MQYLNDRGVEFNSSIVEYDIRHAQINIMRYYNLFEDKKLLDVYDALPKDKRERRCGLLLRKYPELAKSLEKGFNNIVLEFLAANKLDKTDDIVTAFLLRTAPQRFLADTYSALPNQFYVFRFPKD